jgi:DUF1365 family protein
MIFRSALYSGSVMHRRFRPRAHYLRYRVFWMLLDLDELDILPSNIRIFSHNRLNAMSFYDVDHGDGSGMPLRSQIDRHLNEAGIDLDGGAIKLLCMPRILGYGFNPLSVYFCYRRDGALAAIVYEVHNTFRQRHCYLVPVQPSASTMVEQHCRKAFYVSPFMDMDLTYRFRVIAPDEQVSVAIRVSDQDGPQLFAALAGKRRTLSEGALLLVFITHPLMTLKVIGAIHWHAARMLLRGFRLRPRPEPPAEPVTTVRAKV